MKTEIIQKAIVLNNDGKMLILRRSETDTRRPLQWDLPGGAFENGEEMIAGVEREILEETGLEVTGTTAIYSKTEYRKWETGEANVVFIFYGVHTNDDNVALSFEHNEHQWVTIVEAIPLFEYNMHRELFEHVLKYSINL